MRVAIITAILIVASTLAAANLFTYDETCGFGFILGTFIGTCLYITGLW